MHSADAPRTFLCLFSSIVLPFYVARFLRDGDRRGRASRPSPGIGRRTVRRAGRQAQKQDLVTVGQDDEPDLGVWAAQGGQDLEGGVPGGSSSSFLNLHP